jgi:hypothetical protein
MDLHRICKVVPTRDCIVFAWFTTHDTGVDELLEIEAIALCSTGSTNAVP